MAIRESLLSWRESPNSLELHGSFSPVLEITSFQLVLILLTAIEMSYPCSREKQTKNNSTIAINHITSLFTANKLAFEKNLQAKFHCMLRQTSSLYKFLGSKLHSIFLSEIKDNHYPCNAT